MIKSKQTAHKDYRAWQRLAHGVYDYDSTDEGPECEILKAIHAAHSDSELKEEREDFEYSQGICDYLAIHLRNNMTLQSRIMAAVSPYAVRLRLRGVL